MPAKLCSEMSLRSFVRTLLVTGLLFALLQTAAPAQETPCLKRTVMANVIANTGNLVSGLKASSFRAQFRGQPVKILSADLDTQPRRIVLLLDASGSMTAPEQGRWKIALSATKDAVEKLSPQDSVALLVFGSKIDVNIDFGQTRQVILQRLSELEPGEKAIPKGQRRTALWDALLEGLKLLGSPQRGDVLYAVTDGGDNASSAHPKEVKRALLAAGVRLFVFLPLLLSAITPEEIEGPNTLLTLTSDTGGILLPDRVSPPPSRITSGQEPLSPAELRTALDSVYSAINSFYRLQIELPRPVDKLREWKLELAPLPRKTKQQAELVYPRELLPCPAP